MIHVIKANGLVEPFNEEKVLNSIRRARVPRELHLQVLEHITSRLYDNIPTSEIYHHITEFLSKSPHPYSRAGYTLKQSIMLLGPTGYPFEDFIARLLSTKGYQTKVRQILMGTCVSHEVDIIAEKDNTRIMVEAKFHNNPGTQSDVHVSLYTHARFNDVREKYHLDEAWIVTNTKTSGDAISYAQCMGMKVMSWSFPEGESLRDLIEKTRMHPITLLSTLSNAQKQTLLENHIILCREIYENQALLDQLHQPEEQRKKTLEEITYICHTEEAV